MREELRQYYERELTFLRQMGVEFAEKYPKIASRLLLEPDGSKDPHVERMIESFAFLAARVHLKVDDDFPEITEALLGILYPNYLRPIPPMTVAQFHLDREQGKLTSGLKIQAGSTLYSSRTVGEMPCKFRTCYDVTLWPFAVSDTQWGTPDRLQPPVSARDTAAFLRVELTCFPDVSFDKLEIPSLVFHLDGEGAVVHALYELLCNNCTRIMLRDPTSSKAQTRTVDVKTLRPIGFADSETALPYSRRSFIGYRLLQEYFAFPEKFFFFELGGFNRDALAGFKNKVEIVFLISPFEIGERQQKLEVGVTSGTVRLGCSPVINLFSQTAEPILLSQTRAEYHVIPDARRRQASEIFSIDEVTLSEPQSNEVIPLQPLYSFRHTSKGRRAQIFWNATRRPSTRKGDDGTEMYISLVDLSPRSTRPHSDTLTVRCICSNRDLAYQLPIGSASGDFEVEGVPSLKRIVALKKPTRAIRPPLGSADLWRLISHLSLNYLSIVEEGKDAFKEILKLYNFSGLPDLERQIEGITQVSSQRHFARVVSENGISFVRGTRVAMEFDEDHFSGGGVYLFAKVLEHFLGLYTSLNSFTQLVATTRQRREPLQLWPPRAGQLILV